VAGGADIRPVPAWLNNWRTLAKASRSGIRVDDAGSAVNSLTEGSVLSGSWMASVRVRLTARTATIQQAVSVGIVTGCQQPAAFSTMKLGPL
jgi:hypothetical protein